MTMIIHNQCGVKRKPVVWLALGFLTFSLLLSGCAKVSTESGYVFAIEDAIDNPSIKDQLCSNVHKYKGDEPMYYADYKPEANFTAQIQLLAPRKNHNISVGPGILFPLPLLPDPWGTNSAVYYHSVPEKEFDRLVVAIYPKPFAPNYFFTPTQVRLDIAGKALFPVKVTRHFSVNLAARQQTLDINRERLTSNSGEFEAYVVEFDIKNIASPSATLHMSGIDRKGVALPPRDYPLSINQSKVFDWHHDFGCKSKM
jgi:hypothetical protein